MEKSSSSLTLRRFTSSSSQEQKSESSQNDKPVQREPLGNLVERQVASTEKRQKFRSEKPTRFKNSGDLRKDLSQKPIGFKNADELRKEKSNPQWAPVTPRTQAQPRAGTNRTPFAFHDFVELETDFDAPENDSSAEAPISTGRPLEKEDSHLLEKEGSFSITAFDHKPGKRLPGLPRFGGLNIISPRNKTRSEKMPTMSTRNRGKLNKQPKEQFSPYEENPFSPYEKAKASKEDISATIMLPDVNAENLTIDDFASILDRLFSSPHQKGKNIELRVMNILYCATGAASALEESDSYPEIGAYAEFLSKGQHAPIITTMYMNALVNALMPHLDKKLRKELEDAYYENSNGMLALQECLARHLKG